MIPPATLALIFGIGGAAAAATYAAYDFAEKSGDSLKLSDLRPSLPWEGLPVPRFVYTKPTFIVDIRKKL